MRFRKSTYRKKLWIHLDTSIQKGDDDDSESLQLVSYSKLTPLLGTEALWFLFLLCVSIHRFLLIDKLLLVKHVHLRVLEENL
mmetsp:Transcript_39822/g.56140  ORF Transcript_39822/g.56140 Transcript_39822/m.56140 type:complete len:83 (-) Transcript_39822:363-611(-)